MFPQKVLKIVYLFTTLASILKILINPPPVSPSLIKGGGKRKEGAKPPLRRPT
jgi:hypothetical protein